jgi:hypothetical protein
MSAPTARVSASGLEGKSEFMPLPSAPSVQHPHPNPPPSKGRGAVPSEQGIFFAMQALAEMWVMLSLLSTPDLITEH